MNMTDIKRPISLQLRPSITTTTTSTRPHSFAASITTASTTIDSPSKKFRDNNNISRGSSTSSGASSSGSSSTSSSGYDSPQSPSLILPYLYVGDQAQTQIDTISSLNIRYILSLQSLPKFLDDDDDTDDETTLCGLNIKKVTSKKVIKDEVEVETITTANENSSCCDNPVGGSEEQLVAQQSILSEGLDVKPNKCGKYVSPNNEHNDEATKVKTKLPTSKDLLPKANSSKDYLVKFKSCVHKLIKAKCINISDTFETLVEKFFDETHNFIEEARRNKCNILVHCKAGVSRSPTIAIAYLMKLKRLDLQDAYNFVKRCRPQISPNLNFMGQLMSYERRLLQRDNHQVFYRCSRLPSPTSCCLSSASNECEAKIVLSAIKATGTKSTSENSGGSRGRSHNCCSGSSSSNSSSSSSKQCVTPPTTKTLVTTTTTTTPPPTTTTTTTTGDLNGASVAVDFGGGSEQCDGDQHYLPDAIHLAA